MDTKNTINCMMDKLLAMQATKEVDQKAIEETVNLLIDVRDYMRIDRRAEKRKVLLREEMGIEEESS
jgi:hypothetical protein